MRPLIPGAGTQAARDVLELGCDEAGFVAPLHALSGSCATTMKGIYLAGSCRGPDAVREAFASGMAAAALALSELVPGRDLVVDPQVAVIDPARCAGCKTCLPLCPYQAISWHDATGVAQVQDILCRGCGTCVAACPSGAIVGCGFSRDMLRAELEGLLS
ncbi:electron transport complex subunit RsxB [mine drainage metagenome]|uniref:Electron transport complex subunit RsxB n=1 Tax=mine drainage metagenome TaxID=410659 RepID=A0A1J5P3T4_9ZZZZ